MLTHIARDCQTNETLHLFTAHPRKELLGMLGKSRAERMFVDSKSRNKTFQTGWIIGGRWFEIYSVTQMRKEV